MRSTRPIIVHRPARRSSRAGVYMVGAYLMLGVLGVAFAVGVRGSLPWAHPEPWLRLPTLDAHLTSVALGVVLGALVIATTRLAVRRSPRVERLAVDLAAPVARLGDRHIVPLAIASSVAEEIVFRGLLDPWIGLWLSSVLFGLAHQIPGPSRWVWVGWTAVVGLLLGSVYVLTGSLLGPIVAHALVNGVNLRWLRDRSEAGATSALFRRAR